MTFDREEYQSNLVWAHRAHLIVNGMFYDDPLCSINGITAHIYCPEDTSPEALEATKDAIRRLRDVVNFRVTRVPAAEWVPLERAA